MHITSSGRRARLAVVSVAALGMIVALLHAPSASASPVERWVDTAAASSGTGTGCGADAAFSTIQAAITASAAGDTVRVCPGTYTGQVVINKANLTLLGAKAGIPAGPDAAAADRGPGESVIEGVVAGGMIQWSGSANVNSTIDGFTIRNFDRNGIILSTSGHRVLNNIITYDPAARPVELPAVNAQQAGISGGVFNGVTLQGNHITGFRYGFNLQSGNLSHAPALLADNYVGDYLISGLVFGNNASDGQVVRNNTFEPGAASVGPAGMSLPTMAIEISDNTFTGRGSGTGIFMVANTRSGVVITGNTISNFNRGINHPRVNATNLDGSPAATNWPTGSTPTEVHLNNFVGNTGDAVWNNTLPSEYDINATCNWWNAPTGPRTTATGPGDRVGWGVSFNPWLIAPAPGGDCVGGLLEPTAEIVASATSGTAPLAIDFDGTASNDLDGTIVSYAWDFGDGATATGPTASHTYVTPGTYVASLTVTDNSGFTGEAFVTVEVSAAQAAPTATAAATPATGPAPLTTTLDASGSSDSDGTIVSYEWDFGDGSTGTGATVTHVYSTPGTYIATVTVTDDDGLTASAEVAVVVNAVPQPQSDNDCKKNGWQAYGFSNQGLCIRYVNTGKDARLGQ